jgi:hypothetical protein
LLIFLASAGQRSGQEILKIIASHRNRCLFEAGRMDDHIPILQNDVNLAVVDEGEVKHLSQQEINADLLRRAGLDVPSLAVPFLVKPSESEFLTWEDPAAAPGWHRNAMAM